MYQIRQILISLMLLVFVQLYAYADINDKTVYLHISTDAYSSINEAHYINFMFIDTFGHKIGYDNKTKQIIKDNYFDNIKYNDKSMATNIETGHSSYMVDLFGNIDINVLQPFRIVVTKDNDYNSYNLQMYVVENLYELDYSKFSRANIHSYLDIGKSHTYEIWYTPNKPLKVIKTATPDDLIEDIKILSKYTYLGNEKFASKLINTIQNIEENPTSRITEYRKLLTDIENKYKKPAKDEIIEEKAYEILKEDIDYIITQAQ